MNWKEYNDERVGYFIASVVTFVLIASLNVKYMVGEYNVLQVMLGYTIALLLRGFEGFISFQKEKKRKEDVIK